MNIADRLIKVLMPFSQEYRHMRQLLLQSCARNKEAVEVLDMQTNALSESHATINIMGRELGWAIMEREQALHVLRLVDSGHYPDIVLRSFLNARDSQNMH